MPYLIQAQIYWLEDSGTSPHVTLRNSDKTLFPPSLAKESSILFNISGISVQKFNLDADGISFSARFSGQEFTVYAPLNCIISIQSKDGAVVVPINHGGSDVQAIIKPRPELTLIQGGSKGDGIPSGKLSLV